MVLRRWALKLNVFAAVAMGIGYTSQVWYSSEKKRFSEQAMLIAAIQAGDEERATQLIVNGADVKSERHTRLADLIRGTFTGHTRSASPMGDNVPPVALLLGRNAVHYFDTKRNTHTALLRLLLAAGASASDRGADGSTPLRLASWCGDLSAVRLLLAHGANPNCRDVMFGFTPLMGAPSPDIATALLEHGAMANTSDCYGETPLMYALDSGRNGVARVLTEHGADYAAHDSFGMSVNDHDKFDILTSGATYLREETHKIR